MAVRSIVFFLLSVVTFSGCQQNAAPPSEPAEVPQPGPAVEDPGPAPEGQWEPDADAAPPAHPDPVDESSATDEDDAGAETQASAPGAGEGGVGQGALQHAAATSQVSLETPESSAEEAVQLKLQSWDKTSKLIDSHKGKIVVVDFWATSCLPCRREFPHLVALQKAHPETVACVSVSLDYSGRKSRPPHTYRDSVLEFLKQQQASTIDNVLSTDDPDELEARLKLAPIPLVWVYDRDGKLRRTFDNGDLEGEEFTYEKDVVPFVESLLSES
jgi:thiol-disulfide isomerase/thioredoxin